MFVKLAGRFRVERVPEEAGRKTPDFQVFAGTTLFIEVKALTIADGEAKRRKIMNDGLTTRIGLERKIDDGVAFATGIQVIQPHQKGSKPYDQSSVKLVTKNLIEKIELNVSVEQFTRGPTLLLVDLCGELLIHGSASDNLQKEFDVPPRSGELWHVAFGEIDAPMKKAQEFEISPFEPSSIKHEGLQREGVLKKFSFIRGIVFHYQDQLWGAAYRHRRNVKVIQFLEKLCREVKIEPG